MIGGIREHVVLDLFSNLKMFKIQGFLLVNLWSQVVTLRGQIVVSRTGGDTLRVVRLCVCAFVRCALFGVCVGVGVGVSR